MAHYDVVVMGGGPAGSTVASLVKKYSPHLKVLLLEKEHFPRHHVGESLLAGASPVLRDMEAYERINHYGFIEKSGATYVWGRDRKPWGFDFDRVVKPLLDRNIPLPELYTKGWQVRRHEYDHQLLLHAAECGVEVREGARVTDVLRESSGDKLTARVTGVEYRDAEGLQRIDCTWLMDCTGQDALLGRELKLRDYSEKMNNYALYGYWTDFNWYEDFLGHPHFTRIFLATSPNGWLWCIPASAEIMSVGLVTTRDILNKAKAKPQDLYLAEIAGCPEVAAILDSASLVTPMPGQKRSLYAVQDWSYTSRVMFGDGWAMAGDAAGFVDPILSSGVMIAHELGQKAAYSINSSFRVTSDAEIKDIWQFYQQTYNTYLNAYRQMAEFWYSNNFLMESWWWEAQRTMMRDDSIPNLTESEAFMLLASGYANRAESLSLFGSYPLEEAHNLVSGLFGVPHEQVDIESDYASHPLGLKDTMRLTDGLYYFQGLVRKTRRVINQANHQYLDLHPAEDVLLRLFDGQHTLADLNQMIDDIRSRGNPLPLRNGIDLVVQLDSIGVLV
jgi:flavin-dependent dehydrogenase